MAYMTNVDYYTVGVFVGLGVIISNASDINYLVQLGYGKGILSRSEPIFLRQVEKKYTPSGNANRDAFHAKSISEHIKKSISIEYLQLSAEESFYLVDEKVLKVQKETTPASNPVAYYTVEEMWEEFVNNLGERFIANYCVYCHYKNFSKIVRGGLKFGVDFVLYNEGGPKKLHAEWAVILQTICREESEKAMGEEITRITTSKDLQTVSRITETVAKGLIICFVIEDIKEGETVTKTHPSILSNYAIRDFVVKRWEPTRNREN